jgi:hypothetical protein
MVCFVQTGESYPVQQGTSALYGLGGDEDGKFDRALIKVASFIGRTPSSVIRRHYGWLARGAVCVCRAWIALIRRGGRGPIPMDNFLSPRGNICHANSPLAIVGCHKE